MPCYNAATDSVIPAKAGIQSNMLSAGRPWIPAFAGMTRLGHCAHNPSARP